VQETLHRSWKYPLNLLSKIGILGLCARPMQALISYIEFQDSWVWECERLGANSAPTSRNRARLSASIGCESRASNSFSLAFYMRRAWSIDTNTRCYWWSLKQISILFATTMTDLELLGAEAFETPNISLGDTDLRGFEPTIDSTTTMSRERSRVCLSASRCRWRNICTAESTTAALTWT
jgi:hypothetical protein